MSSETPPSPSQLDRIEQKLDRAAGLMARAVAVMNAFMTLKVNRALDMDQARHSGPMLAKVADPQAVRDARTIQYQEDIQAGRIKPKPRRDPDEITLVRIPLLKAGDERKAIRVNKRLAKLIYLGIGLLLYWGAKKIGVPLHVIE